MIRGLWTHADVLYAVDADTLYRVDSAGLQTALVALNSLAGNVDFASNLTQLCINDGSYLYVYTPSSGVMTTAAGYTGGDRISFLDQRINFQMRGTQQFGWTAVGDATSIDALDFASAETSPDLLVSQLVANRELYLLGVDSSEIWDPVGGQTVYSRSSAAIDYGCIAAHSAQKTANAVVWLGREKNGQAVVISVSGHQPRRISNRGIEDKLASVADLSGAKAFSYSEGGLSFYCLNVPGLDTTLVWEETFQQWHEKAECYTGKYTKWRPTCHAFAYGKHYFGADTGLYTSDPDYHLFGSDPIRRSRIAPVISDPTHKRVTFSLFEILCEQGTGATVMMRFSDDDGRNWSNWAYTTVGALGEFAHRARFRRLGAAFDRVFEVCMTDNAPFNPVGVNVPL